MPAPGTIWDDATDQALGTFDRAGNLALAGGVFVGGASDQASGTVPVASAARLYPLFEKVLDVDVPNTTQVFADVASPSVSLGVLLTPGVWSFEWIMPYTASVSGASGLFTQLVGTVTFSKLLYFLEIQSSNATTASFTRRVLTSPSSSTTVTTAGTEYKARVIGRIAVTGAGTLIPQFECSAAATTTTIKADSYVQYRQTA